jgi:2-methylisocitrate lyase-like PEP mutase family enzyme
VISRDFRLEEAIGRINAAAEVGADLGLVFPRSRSEAEAAPRLAKAAHLGAKPEQSRWPPILSLGELEQMGYRGCIDAQILLGVAFHFMKQALAEIAETGSYTGISDTDFTAVRKEIEDLILLDVYYRIEAETVERDQSAH